MIVTALIALMMSLVRLVNGLGTHILDARSVLSTSHEQSWPVTGFTASKTHNSGYCSFSFNVSTPTIDSASYLCTAYKDAGFSGATYLALVWDGTCKNSTGALSSDVSWHFSQPTNDGTVSYDAKLNVTRKVDGVISAIGMYTIPGADIKISLNNKDNPFDNDVYYGGPKDFNIKHFEYAQSST